jgi:transcriptional regulator with XRE-family HTH domain
MDLSPSQCRAARGLLDITQAELAEKAGVSLRTVISFEASERSPIRATLDVIRRAFETEGVEFIDENGGGAGVRLKAAKKRSKN